MAEAGGQAHVREEIAPSKARVPDASIFEEQGCAWLLYDILHAHAKVQLQQIADSSSKLVRERNAYPGVISCNDKDPKPEPVSPKPVV